MNPGSKLALVLVAALLLGGCTICPTRFTAKEEAKKAPPVCQPQPDKGEGGVWAAMPLWF